MALDKKEIQAIAESTADEVIGRVKGNPGMELSAPDCKDPCIGAGMAFARVIKDAPAVFPVNLAGLVTTEDLRVPHSDLAMDVGAAGKELLSWSLTEDGRYAHIVYQDGGGCCRYTHGLSTEVMVPRLVELTKKMLGGGS